MKEIRLILCADTEDNHPSYLPGWKKYGSDYDINPPRFRDDWTKYWEDLEIHLSGLGIRPVWFLRVDKCIKGKFIEKNKEKILDLKKKGHELGIHIHTLEWNGRSWSQTLDPVKEKEIIAESIRIFKDILGFSPKLSRMGWNAMSNSIMAELQEQGIVLDASALPDNKNDGSLFWKRDNMIDWAGCLKKPYRPDCSDYLKLGKMRIIECPISTIGRKGRNFSKAASLIPRKALNIFMSGSIGLLDKLGLYPYNYLTISPYWNVKKPAKIIKSHVRNGKDYVVGYFHPSDILDPRTGKMNKSYLNKFSSLVHELEKGGIRLIPGSLMDLVKEGAR